MYRHSLHVYSEFDYASERLWCLSQRNGKKQVAFTFDDGPHPKYTPILLDLLKLHQVKATFSC